MLETPGTFHRLIAAIGMSGHIDQCALLTRYSQIIVGCMVLKTSPQMHNKGFI